MSHISIVYYHFAKGPENEGYEYLVYWLKIKLSVHGKISNMQNRQSMKHYPHVAGHSPEKEAL